MAELRLIDANALPNFKCKVTATIGEQKGPAEMRFVFWQDIENAPTIDAVEVVRCKECKYRRKTACPMRSLRVATRGRGYRIQDNMVNDGFCHMGAKMDGGAENG